MTDEDEKKVINLDWRDHPCVEWHKYACCEKEDRDMNGWCKSCGDPCF